MKRTMGSMGTMGTMGTTATFESLWSKHSGEGGWSLHMWCANTSCTQILMILILNVLVGHLAVGQENMGPEMPWHICSTAMKENSLAIKSVTWLSDATVEMSHKLTGQMCILNPQGLPKWETTMPMCLGLSFGIPCGLGNPMAENGIGKCGTWAA